MQPYTTPEDSAETTRLAFPDPVRRNQLAVELEQHLAALNSYCDQEPQPLIAFQLNEFIAALGQYDQATEQLLADYQYALEHAQRPVSQPVPTLEQAVLAKMSSAEVRAYREKDPVCRLGFMRGQHQAAQRYWRLTSLYAQHAIIVPPVSYKPTLLVAQVQRFVSTRLMTGPRLPLLIRKSLFFSTPINQPTDAQP
jgi:hypothetical protein